MAFNMGLSMAPNLGPTLSELRIGIQRETMKKNPLILKPRVGRVFKRGLWLPEDNFTYGQRNITSDGGTAEAMCWNIKTEQNPRRRIDAPEKDFVKLNKYAATAGLTTAKQQSGFRLAHDYRRPTETELALAVQSKRPIFAQKIKTAIHGTRTKPATPMNLLISHAYLHAFLEKQIAAHRRSSKKVAKKKIDISTREEKNVAFTARRSVEQNQKWMCEPLQLWKMPRFSKATAHPSTYKARPAKSEKPKPVLDTTMDKTDGTGDKPQTLAIEAATTQEGKPVTAPKHDVVKRPPTEDPEKEKLQKKIEFRPQKMTNQFKQAPRMQPEIAEEGTVNCMAATKKTLNSPTKQADQTLCTAQQPETTNKLQDTEL